MARIIGVGLDHSKVIITCNAGGEVIKCEETEWEVLWAEAVTANSSFMVMSIEVSEQHESSQFNTLSSSEMSAMFGVGLDGSAVVNYAYEGADVVHANDPEFESLLWRVAKHLVKLQDSTATGRQHTTADSGGGNEGQGVYNNGRDLGKEQNLQNSSALNIGPNQGGSGDGDEDFRGGAGNGRGEILVGKPLSLRVTVRPGLGGKVMSPEFGAEPPESVSNVLGMFPILTFDFAKQEAYKRISVEIFAECALGGLGPKLREEERFGWYHDNIHVSFKCEETDTSILLPGYGIADMGETLKTSTSASSTQSTGFQSQNQSSFQITVPVAGIGVQSTSNATHNTGGSGTIAENYEMCSKLIEGFFYRDESSTGGARLSYGFVFSGEVPKDVWRPIPQKRRFLQSGLYSTWKTTINGTWEPLDERENTPYRFVMKRELHERLKIANSIEESGSCEYLQEYLVDLFLNHAMTHLNQVNSRNRVLNEDIKEILKVISLGQKFE